MLTAKFALSCSFTAQPNSVVRPSKISTCTTQFWPSKSACMALRKSACMAPLACYVRPPCCWYACCTTLSLSAESAQTKHLSPNCSLALFLSQAPFFSLSSMCPSPSTSASFYLFHFTLFPPS